MEKEKAEDARYQEKVMEQMKKFEQLEKSDDEKKESEADQRRRRRQEFLQKRKTQINDENAALDDKLTPIKRSMEEKDRADGLGEGGLVKANPLSENVFDMFSDTVQKPTAVGNIGVSAGTAVDRWDDHEGYYRFQYGDIMHDRYRVVANAGKGVFSTVLRIHDTHDDDQNLVVKIIRNNETMFKLGVKELAFLDELAKKDPENRRHVIRIITSFQHHNHLCLVFEAMHMNLREVLKKVGGIGLSVSAVKVYSKQLFTALRHLKKCGILHGDIKPDNILVNENNNVVKLCDFGSAGRLNHCEITPYLVSRFYRAPEIMLGLKYNELSDMWSFGCVLFELYTGKILFDGKENNAMLEKMMKFKGCFPKKMLKAGEFTQKHFDSELGFKMKQIDPLTKATLTTIVKNYQPTRNIHDEMKRFAIPTASEHETHKVSQLSKMLDKIFSLDPSRRLTVEQALHDNFIREE